MEPTNDEAPRQHGTFGPDGGDIPAGVLAAGGVLVFHAPARGGAPRHARRLWPIRSPQAQGAQGEDRCRREPHPLRARRPRPRRAGAGACRHRPVRTPRLGLSARGSPPCRRATPALFTSPRVGSSASSSVWSDLCGRSGVRTSRLAASGRASLKDGGGVPREPGRVVHGLVTDRCFTTRRGR